MKDAKYTFYSRCNKIKTYIFYGISNVENYILESEYFRNVKSESALFVLIPI